LNLCLLTKTTRRAVKFNGIWYLEALLWRSNQNQHINEEQTTPWPKEKAQKDKQLLIKHTHKTKDWETRIPPKTGDELRCSGRVYSSCSTSGTRRVNLVINPVISHEWGNESVYDKWIISVVICDTDIPASLLAAVLYPFLTGIRWQKRWNLIVV
jgi:hypothetical protein